MKPLRTAAETRRRLVLNIGSGPYSPRKLHPAFSTPDWRQIRLDIDPAAKPDLVGSITRMDAVVGPRSVDAVWSSHSLEHLHSHEVDGALGQVRRVLKPTGFVLITCPDLESIARLVVQGALEAVAYTSPAGPITALDMLFGHSASIAHGNHYMAHHTGFTCARLGEALLRAGFPVAWAKPGAIHDLWAVGLMEEAEHDRVRHDLRAGGLDLFAR